METLLIIKIGIALIFGLAVAGKISGKLNAIYVKWNYSVSFMYGLAALEALCIIGLFTKFANYAVYILLAIMVGAIFTLLSKREALKEYPMALLASALLIAYVMMTHQ